MSLKKKLYMKSNKKALELVEKGLSTKTIIKLTEAQIDVLHSRLYNEQVTKTDKPVYNVKGSGGNVSVPMPKGASVTKTPTGDVVVTPNEGEMKEGKVKKGEPNPWAICHAQVGPKKSRKFERCVREVKKSLKEGKNPVSLFLENEIMRIVEKHIPPRITKGDLIKYLSEDVETAPSKPKTNPTTKPGTKPGTKPRPKHPGQNPNPGENPAPKAISPEKAKDEVINAIMKLLEK